MKKKYLQIIVYRGEEHNSTSYYLLSDNVTGFTFESNSNETRVYFKNANPFSFVRLHITNVQFLQILSHEEQIVTVAREGSSFSYLLTTI
jgi:hypothetical protein